MYVALSSRRAEYDSLALASLVAVFFQSLLTLFCLMTVDTPLLLCGDHGCALIAYAILGAMTQYRPKFSFNAMRRNYDALSTCSAEILSLLFACQISQKYFPYFLHARFLRNTFLTFCMPDFSEILSLLFACQISQKYFPYFLHARFLRNTF